MKLYYTLAQSFVLAGENMTLNEYLDEQGIKYKVGADWSYDLGVGVAINDEKHVAILMKYFVVLLDEYELTVIKMAVDGVIIADCRPFVNFKNRIRKYFS